MSQVQDKPFLFLLQISAPLPTSQEINLRFRVGESLDLEIPRQFKKKNAKNQSQSYTYEENIQKQVRVCVSRKLQQKDAKNCAHP